MKKIFILTLASLAIFGCSVTDMTPEEDGGLEFEGITVDETRTTLEKVSDVYNVLWTSGDKIIVTDGTNYPTYKVKTGGTTTGIFKWASGRDVSSSAAQYMAVYPSSAFVGGVCSLPAEQTYVAGQPYQFPMVAQSTTNSLKFKNPCGILRLNVSSSNSSFKVAAIDLESDLPVSGPAEINFDEGSLTVLEEGSHKVSLNCGRGVAVSNGGDPVPFYVVLPTGKHKLKITIWTTDEVSQTVVSAAAVPIVASTITNADIAFDSFSASISYGDANCVIATPGTPVTFSVAPHGVTTSCLVDNSVSTTNFPKATSAEVIWKEFSGNVNVSLNAADSKLTVTTPAGEYGNALVAIRNGSDIIWSFHIWVPQDDPTKTIRYDKFSSASTAPYMMPMLLGATKITKVGDSDAAKLKGVGLYYQWGRKDPFPRMTKFTSSDQTDTRIPSILASTMLGGMTAHQTTTAIEYATKHPDMYIAWAAPSTSWNGTEPNDKLWQNTKTVYDPCPKGYHVAPSTAYARITDQANWYGSFNKGWTYIVGTDAAGNPVYDFYVTSGDRYGGQAEPEGGYICGPVTKIRCWTCTPAGTSANYVSGGSTSNQVGNYGTTHYARGFALPLRCCAD